MTLKTLTYHYGDINHVTQPHLYNPIQHNRRNTSPNFHMFTGHGEDSLRKQVYNVFWGSVESFIKSESYIVMLNVTLNV